MKKLKAIINLIFCSEYFVLTDNSAFYTNGKTLENGDVEVYVKKYPDFKATLSLSKD